MEKETREFNHGLLEFISKSPTPFHAVQQVVDRLADAGYQQLFETDSWDLQPNTGYWLTRNGSSIIAFHTGGDLEFKNGIRFVGAHTDSPCLKIKPNPEMKGAGCQRLAVEVYGGALLAPWFDRDLSLAGRVTFVASDGSITSRLIDFKKPIAVIPSLAIHLNRDANDQGKIQRQKELNLVVANGSDKPDFEALLAELVSADLGEAVEILDHEIYAYDTQAPAIVGLNDEFVSSARLDNLLSCYIGMKALLGSTDAEPKLLICHDHEEVGSQSASGAQGPFLRDFLERITSNPEHFNQVIARSMFVSADNAHGIHPNFPEKHDAGNGPKINDGPVIKVNASQRYATNSETAGLFKIFAKEASVELQTFVSRNDLACGSTIGPITASELGVATVDVGCPQWGMHSIRETAGTEDAKGLAAVLAKFYSYDKPLKVS